MAITSYRDLEVWQRGMELAVGAYTLTRSFPKEELFGMTSQIRRAAASIPANIAEGWARNAPREFVRFLRIAQGSLRELETHLLLTSRVELTTEEIIQPLMGTCDLIGRQLHRLQESLQIKIAAQDGSPLTDC